MTGPLPLPLTPPLRLQRLPSPSFFPCDPHLPGLLSLSLPLFYCHPNPLLLVLPYLPAPPAKLPRRPLQHPEHTSRARHSSSVARPDRPQLARSAHWVHRTWKNEPGNGQQVVACDDEAPDCVASLRVLVRRAASGPGVFPTAWFMYVRRLFVRHLFHRVFENLGLGGGKSCTEPVSLIYMPSKPPAD